MEYNSALFLNLNVLPKRLSTIKSIMIKYKVKTFNH